MSKQKNPEVRIQGHFSGLVDQLRDAEKLIASLIPKRGKHKGSKNRGGKAKRGRSREKAARRARRFNRRSTKRPKGYRKPR